MQRGNGNVIVIIRVTSIEDSQANVILDEDNSYIEWHDRDDWGEHHIVLRGKYCRWFMRECKMKWEYILSLMAWLIQLNNHLNFKEKLVEKHPHSLFKAKTPTLLHFLKDVQSVHIDQHPLEHPPIPACKVATSTSTTTSHYVFIQSIRINKPHHLLT